MHVVHMGDIYTEMHVCVHMYIVYVHVCVHIHIHVCVCVHKKETKKQNWE